MSHDAVAPIAGQGKMPRQIPYIIGNEACERFSFYGMRNILVQFLITSLLLQEITAEGRAGEAKDIMHSFMIGVYFFPLLGGWPTGSSASTTPFSGSAWSTVPAICAWRCSRTAARASSSAWA